MAFFCVISSWLALIIKREELLGWAIALHHDMMVFSTKNCHHVIRLGKSILIREAEHWWMQEAADRCAWAQSWEITGPCRALLSHPSSIAQAPSFFQQTILAFRQWLLGEGVHEWEYTHQSWKVLIYEETTTSISYSTGYLIQISRFEHTSGFSTHPYGQYLQASWAAVRDDKAAPSYLFFWSGIGRTPSVHLCFIDPLRVGDTVGSVNPTQSSASRKQREILTSQSSVHLTGHLCSNESRMRPFHDTSFSNKRAGSRSAQIHLLVELRTLLTTGISHFPEVSSL